MIPYYYGTSPVDIDYAMKRLSNTYVFRTDGSLFYIESVGIDADSKPFFQGWGEKEPAAIKSEELDMTPITLGYTIVEDREFSSFLSRLPSRSGFKQGLSMSSVSLSHGSRGHLRFNSILIPARNKYQTFKEVRDLAHKFRYDLPFSRHFAVSKNKDLVYRGQFNVGKINKQGDAILEPRWSYLQQHLDTVTK